MKLSPKWIKGIKKSTEKFVPYSNIEKTKNNLEKMLTGQYQKMEPLIADYYQGWRKNAVRVGIPVDTLETKFQESLAIALGGIEKIGIKIPFFVDGKKPSTKARRPKTKRKKSGKAQAHSTGAKA